ncbi:MAG: hypothetical protein ACTHJZ_13940 [Trinickia sp.]|jgi:hypothetical protein|uniref:hypothetical protein n=1 Tax=Trinickia sp. TaxID=2571163 RepID=UPI002F3EBA0F
MERLIRIANDDDRQALAWLMTHAGNVRVTEAARHLAHSGRPVFVSALCRYLGIWPPAPRRPVRAAQDCVLAEQHLAQIRRILAGAKPATAAVHHR